MTESEWLACTDPVECWTPLRGKVSERKHRLFVCAWCRLRYRKQLAAVLRALEAAERAADERMGEEELAAAEEEAFEALRQTRSRVAHLAVWALHPHPGKSSGQVLGCLRKDEGALHTAVLRELFGNPFRTITLDSTLRTPSILSLAQAAYEERHLSSGILDTQCLAILADALEDAGCDSADLLSHLRGSGPHVRGCWVLDLLLGKQ